VVQARELGVARRALAVGHRERVGRVARLLREELREPDHLGVAAERLGEVEHAVRGVLLRAGLAGREERRERGDGERVALLPAAGFGLRGDRGLDA
jgi:hypothetical protein